MAINEHNIELINRSIDGDLNESEQAELDSILANSEEAKTLHDELAMMAAQLENAPSMEPPKELERDILNQIELPQPKGWFTWAAGWMQGRPVSHTLALLAGVLATVVYYQFSPSTNDLSGMTGTMVSSENTIAQLEIEEAAVNGTVSLIRQGEHLVLQIDVESQLETELHGQMKDLGLALEAVTDHSGQSMQGFLFARGNFSIAASRKKNFSMLLSAPEGNDEAIAQGISVAFTQNKGMLFRSKLVPEAEGQNG